MNTTYPENQYMAMALKAALQTASSGDVPVGAVVVHQNNVIGTGWNRRERENRVSAHAEMIALDEACRLLGNWKLNDCDLYVTLEPCSMCASAIMQARMRAVFFGAWDPKAGAAGSVMDLFRAPWVNHRVTVYEGIMADQCQEMLTEFFRNLRGK